MSDQHLTLLYIKLPFPFPDHLDSGSFAPTVLQLSVLIFITVLQLSEDKFSSVGKPLLLGQGLLSVVGCLLSVVGVWKGFDWRMVCCLHHCPYKFSNNITGCFCRCSLHKRNNFWLLKYDFCNLIFDKWFLISDIWLLEYDFFSLQLIWNLYIRSPLPLSSPLSDQILALISKYPQEATRIFVGFQKVVEKFRTFI